MKLRLLWLLVLVAWLSGPALGDWDRGVAAYQQGDYATSAMEWGAAAEKGDARAQFNLGLMYEDGLGVQKNDAEAERWYRAAAEQGYADAQFNLGRLYYLGLGVPQNDAEAVRWYRLAAEQGNPSAQSNLGSAYDAGQGVPQDSGEAVRWYRLAAEQGLAAAQFNLGLQYANGSGVPQSESEALRWFRLAAEQGVAQANTAIDMINRRSSVASSDGKPEPRTSVPVPQDSESSYPVVRQISAGRFHTCAITWDGAAFCWGEGQNGALGDGSDQDRATPTSVAGLTSGVTHISAGESYSCAVHNGAAKCWGKGKKGQLGQGLDADTNTPVQVKGLTSGVSHISAGKSHTCAVHNGAAKCWGSGGEGLLGQGAEASANTPVQVKGLTSGVSHISAGESHTCAVHNGAAKCWGWGLYGKLGIQGWPDDLLPVQVVGLTSGVTQISAGAEHTCAIHNGAAKCWGNDEHNRLGVGRSQGDGHKPITVPSLSTGVTHISSGRAHTCAIHNAAAKCWGQAQHGAIGIDIPEHENRYFYSPPPSQVALLTSAVSDISAGCCHSCAVHNGSAKCWGAGQSGALGDDTVRDQLTPVRVVGLLSAEEQGVLQEENHKAALADARALAAWHESIKPRILEGEKIAKESSAEWRLEQTTDELTGITSVLARTTSRNKQGATAISEVRCTPTLLDNKYDLIITTTLTTGSAPLELEVNWLGDTFIYSNGRNRVNGSVDDTRWVATDFENQLTQEIEGGLKEGFFGFLPMSHADDVEFEILYDWMVELTTDRGPLVVQIPPFDPAIQRVIKSCLEQEF